MLHLQPLAVGVHLHEADAATLHYVERNGRLALQPLQPRQLAAEDVRLAVPAPVVDEEAPAQVRDWPT